MDVGRGIDFTPQKQVVQSVEIITPASSKRSQEDTGCDFSPMPATPSENELIADFQMKMAKVTSDSRILNFEAGENPQPYEGCVESPDVLGKFNGTSQVHNDNIENIQVESPDILSKFNSTRQQLDSGRESMHTPIRTPVSKFADESGHDFSPMPATPSSIEPLTLHYKSDIVESSNGGMPSVIGQGVVVESPDVFEQVQRKWPSYDGTKDAQCSCE